MRDSASLGPRLRACFRAVPAEAPVADVGADHAHLALALVSSGRVPSAIVVERLDAPLARARLAVAGTGLSARIETRLGDGLAALEPGEVSSVCLAGIGARNIVAILERGAAVRNTLSTLVFQPLLDASPLRRHLRGSDWKIVNEELALERGRIYEIIVARPGAGDPGYEGLDAAIAELLGPCLLRSRGPLFDRRVQWLCRVREKSLSALRLARGGGAREKEERIVAELEALRALRG